MKFSVTALAMLLTYLAAAGVAAPTAGTEPEAAAADAADAAVDNGSLVPGLDPQHPGRLCFRTCIFRDLKCPPGYVSPHASHVLNFT
jgi:hypothetical protein